MVETTISQEHSTLESPVDLGCGELTEAQWFAPALSSWVCTSLPSSESDGQKAIAVLRLEVCLGETPFDSEVQSLARSLVKKIEEGYANGEHGACFHG